MEELSPTLMLAFRRFITAVVHVRPWALATTLQSANLLRIHMIDLIDAVAVSWAAYIFRSASSSGSFPRCASHSACDMNLPSRA